MRTLPDLPMVSPPIDSAPLIAQLEQSQSLVDAWRAIAWQDFIDLLERPEYQRCKAYYHNQKMWLETMPTGSDHAEAHAILIFMIGLYGMLRDIALTPKDNCTFRLAGREEFQPDIAYYVAEQANHVPQGIRIIDLAQFVLPDLVIEVADTTVNADLGEKRLQYEDLGIREYWVWQVQTAELVAFAIGPGASSRRIRQSVVLPGLDLGLLEAAMRQSWEANQSAIGRWLMQQWQD
jgi:Uma2 family endonuclease